MRPPPSVVKVPKDKVDEATRRALEDGLVLAPYAEEVDGFSSRQLLLSAATPSKHEVVRDLKSLLLGCARDPRWLAAMSGELDKLANGCDRRNTALIRLKDASHVSEPTLASGSYASWRTGDKTYETGATGAVARAPDHERDAISLLSVDEISGLADDDTLIEEARKRASKGGLTPVKPWRKKSSR